MSFLPCCKIKEETDSRVNSLSNILDGVGRITRWHSEGCNRENRLINKIRNQLMAEEFRNRTD